MGYCELVFHLSTKYVILRCLVGLLLMSFGFRFCNFVCVFMFYTFLFCLLKRERKQGQGERYGVSGRS